MILGVIDTQHSALGFKDAIVRAAMAASGGRTERRPSLWISPECILCSVSEGIPARDEGPQPFINAEKSLVLVFQGKIYNLDEINRLLSLESPVDAAHSGTSLLHLYEKYGMDFLNKVNGKFSFMLFDIKNKKTILARDRFGIEPLYYHWDQERLLFASSLKGLLSTKLIGARLNPDALLQYLLYCYNPAADTFIQGIKKLPASHLAIMDSTGFSIKRYWFLSFASQKRQKIEDYCEGILSLLKDSVKIRLDERFRPGVFLSGGTDSSALTSLITSMSAQRLSTFSFGCRGKSYDETSYSRFMAEQYHTEHYETDYTQEAFTRIEELIDGMEEPFCDIGIEMGTFLLGALAQNKVDYIMSGEGGDELFAGHPSYGADKTALALKKIPVFLLSPLFSLGKKLPDGQSKKSLSVKIKRFSYSMGFPETLMSNRWRIYYTPGELKKLCNPQVFAGASFEGVYRPVETIAAQADGPDYMSRTLYCDFYTLVSFYLERLRLLRLFGLENRLPLLDYRLAEYAATIPFGYKLKGIEGTKYIYRKALEKVLPGKILYERPKLGHSVPMKNWMRELFLDSFIRDLLCEKESPVNRLFDGGIIRKMMDEHASGRQNYSHRIWAFVVLNLWVKRHGVY